MIIKIFLRNFLIIPPLIDSVLSSGVK